MFAWTYRKEVLTRIVLIFMVLVNTAVPTVAALANSMNMGKETAAKELVLPPSTPPVQPKVYYTPDEDQSNILNFSPDYSEELPSAPEKDVVEFSVFASKGELAADRVLTLNVKVRNTAQFAVMDLNYQTTCKT